MIQVFEDKSLISSDISHGFFSRHGGHSKGIYKGLNIGLGSEDDRSLVLANRDLVASHFKIPTKDLNTLYQIHSNKVIRVTKDTQLKDREKADGMVTNVRGCALGILTADCTPVLFADTKNGVVGAAHAGWQGALGGILKNTITAMEGLGADRQNIRAVIGPSIAQESYEVGPEFRDAFLNKDPSYAIFFLQNENHKFQFNLTGFNENMLLQEKIESVKTLNLDTYALSDDFYSYRRSTHREEDDYGRQISVILLN